MIHLRLKQYPEALSSVKSALSQDPNLAEAYAYRGICQYKLGNTLPALHDIERSEEEGFVSPLGLVYHAKALLATGDEEAAAQVLTRCEQELAQGCHERSRITYKLGIDVGAKSDSEAMGEVQEQREDREGARDYKALLLDLHNIV